MSRAQADSVDFAGIDAALRRAARSALTLARKTKTPCYIWKDGAIIDIATKLKRQPVKEEK